MAIEKLITPEFRVSFPSVFAPTAFDDKQEKKYKLNMLFPKGTDLAPMIALAKKVADARWPDLATRPKKLKNPFRDGDVEKPDTEGYAGHMFVSATSKMKPGVVDQAKQEILSADATDGGFYAGCYARASVTAYAYDKFGNAGVAFGLQHVQKLRDGDEFSGRGKAEDEFDAVESVEVVDNAGSSPTDSFLG